MVPVKPSLILQVDGTPGHVPTGTVGLGVVVRSPRGDVLRTRCLRAAAASCNAAEYQAVIAGLTLMLRLYPGTPVRCLSDSRLVIDQLTGRAAVREEALRALYVQAQALCQQFGQLELVAIPRELNRLADALAWEALGGRMALIRFQGG
ncbi:ribonuclease HI family protein [Candidatus Chloroploca sp. Khr17]|uniref:ribonuclease HI family protein n=1 Tax=Candidatus Chloroploca sp. Khr17 TaxID=2496869 RepID=UPI00101D2799|nr:ribonuclease HI family protein [Candidatus Chloroploca sp. Khr17]